MEVLETGHLTHTLGIGVMELSIKSDDLDFLVKYKDHVVWYKRGLKS